MRYASASSVHMNSMGLFARVRAVTSKFYKFEFIAKMKSIDLYPIVGEDKREACTIAYLFYFIFGNPSLKSFGARAIN